MTLKVPYPPDLLRIARKVVWYERPEQTLQDLDTFLAHLMVYGSPADVAVTGQYVSAEEFRRVLKNAPAGLFTQEVWQKWHEQLGMPVQPLPRRRFPDGSFGPEPGHFFGR
ncbi:MAG: hypothetical protein ABSB15_06625 [Bryobacteraceae bacterium]|jgi:hypothetical protein